MFNKLISLTIGILIVFAQVYVIEEGELKTLNFTQENIEIVYHNFTTDELPQVDKDDFIHDIDDSIKFSEERFRLWIDNDRVNMIKEKEKAIEISLSRSRTISHEKYGDLEISKVIIPLTGDLVTEPNSPLNIVLTLVGEEWIAWGVILEME